MRERGQSQNIGEAASKVLPMMPDTDPLKSTLAELGKSAAGRRSGIYKMYVTNNECRGNTKALLQKYNEANLAASKRLNQKLVADASSSSSPIPVSPPPDSDIIELSDEEQEGTPKRKKPKYSPKREKHPSPLSLMQPPSDVQMKGTPRSLSAGKKTKKTEPTSSAFAPGTQFVLAQKYASKTAPCPVDLSELPDFEKTVDYLGLIDFIEDWNHANL